MRNLARSLARAHTVSGKMFIPYGVLLLFLGIISVSAQLTFVTHPQLAGDIDFQLLILGGFLFIGYYINKIAPATVIPSFVWAIFAGMALQPVLSFYTHDVSALAVVMEIFGAIILFAGGLEIPFKNFRNYFFPIMSLSLFGVVISAFAFSLALYWATALFTDFDVFILPSIAILSMALVSTDTNGIVSTLQSLRFKRPFLKQVAVAESALTDVSGSVFTRFLIIALVSVPLTTESSVFSVFSPLFKKATYDAFALQIISGIVVGYMGFALLKHFYGKTKNSGGLHAQTDPALLFAVPIFTFVLGNALGGAGFLAAFVSGLLFSDERAAAGPASHFYENILNHLIKPSIFIVLGALVPVATLFNFAPLGVFSALLFMFVIRPFVVSVSLLPWIRRGVFRLGDILFLSFIRETGIMAAILLIIAATSEVISSDFVISIGMWVILMTLVIEPPLTPYVAKEVGAAEMTGKM
ncbi:cation:proton antiporter [bacterium]|nr:cation:proton antiporter [bacterium]MCI0565981.1 cation:proton antiporter [bacterium]MCI0680061.1 cation:proton antiporter [bacterium]